LTICTQLTKNRLPYLLKLVNQYKGKFFFIFFLKKKGKFIFKLFLNYLKKKKKKGPISISYYIKKEKDYKKLINFWNKNLIIQKHCTIHLIYSNHVIIKGKTRSNPQNSIKII
jgi:hypothetical protein